MNMTSNTDNIPVAGCQAATRTLDSSSLTGKVEAIMTKLKDRRDRWRSLAACNVVHA